MNKQYDLNFKITVNPLQFVLVNGKDVATGFDGFLYSISKQIDKDDSVAYVVSYYRDISSFHQEKRIFVEHFPNFIAAEKSCNKENQQIFDAFIHNHTQISLTV